MARISDAEAAALTHRYFGIAGHAIQLGGERTQNFHIRTADGPGFTLKVSDAQEDAGLVALENEALRHIARNAPHIGAPRVVAALDGRDSVALGPQDGRHLRLLTYLPGTPLVAVANPSADLRAAVGHAVAELDRALRSFDHPLAHARDLIWHIRTIADVRPFLALIDAQRRPLAEAMLQRFEARAMPRMAALPAQVVHSDMNGQNILADDDNSDRLAGFLDFGDVSHAPRIVDLAGAALLQIGSVDDDLSAAGQVAAAYHRASPLEALEIELLPEIMIARCIINVTVTERLAARDPANRSYIMKNNATSWMRLQRLSSVSGDVFNNILPAVDEGSTI